MNMMMIRLLSTISLAVVAILGADLSAATKVETTKAEASAETKKGAQASDTKTADPVKKDELTPPVTITEKTMSDVEAMLGKSTIVDALGGGDKMIQGAIPVAANADDKDIRAKLKDKKAMIVVYCWGVSCPAGMTLAERLVGMGYTNVCHYAGGIKEWTENNKPITVSKSK